MRQKENASEEYSRRLAMLGSCAATLASVVAPESSADEESATQPDTTITDKASVAELHVKNGMAWRGSNALQVVHIAITACA